MKKITWRKHHKWLGILFCFFMLMFCLSGIILNHRALVSDINVGRSWLPQRYHYSAWNGGLLRGTKPYAGSDSVSRILVYGASGIWQTDSAGASFSDFNNGLPSGADYRQIKNVATTLDGELFAASIFGLYRYDSKTAAWQSVRIPTEDDELITDVISRNDTLIVAGRSFLYLSTAPYTSFEKIQLMAPDNYSRETSLFRTIWMLHSGELFGLPGRIIVDLIAVVLILLCVTGIAFWLLPKYIRRKRQNGKNTPTAQWLTRTSFLWHDKIGRTTIVLTIFIAVTGWCLRPPLMIPLALTKVATVPGTALHSSNPWHDKLRVIRYDDNGGDWLLSTSEGFYSLRSLHDTPVKIDSTPPVSVMGLNVFQKDTSGNWLCGSFSGMYVWNRKQNTVTDYFTGATAADVSGPPFGKQAVSGYSSDLRNTPFAVEYNEGTDVIIQPAELEKLPMSLWNFALEVHTGRIYMGAVATYIFIFLAGIAAFWCLWSGWKIRKKI